MNRSLSSTLLALAITVCHAPRALADPPWWQARHALKLQPGSTDPVTQRDFSAINQGQLKQLATAAFDEMEAQFGNFGGAGPVLTALIKSWHQLDANGEIAKDASGRRIPKVTAGVTRDFAPASFGQLKAVATVCYARLIETGLASDNPWHDSPALNQGIANIGQAKALFSFDPGLDSDFDGLTDADEINFYYTDPRNPDTNGDGILDGFQVANFYGDNPADNDANRPGLPVLADGAGGNSTTASFTYDALGRLKTSTTPALAVTYYYDEEGNINSVSR